MNFIINDEEVNDRACGEYGDCRDESWKAGKISYTTYQRPPGRFPFGKKYGKSLEEIVGKLSLVIRDWNNYHTAIRPVRERLLKLNYYVQERIRIFLKRKYSDESRGYRRVSGEMLARLGLCQFG